MVLLNRRYKTYYPSATVSIVLSYTNDARTHSIQHDIVVCQSKFIRFEVKTAIHCLQKKLAQAMKVK